MSDRSQDSVPWRTASRRLTIENGEKRFWDSFGIAKFEVNNYYAYYRRGIQRAGQPWKFANAVRNPDLILFHHIDQFRRIRGSWENIYKVARPEQGGGRYAFALGLGPSPDTDAIAGTRTLQQDFRDNHIPFRILKILGAGGNGVALLCDNRSSDHANGIRKRFVVKVDRRRRATMREEKAHMMALKRAPHIAQMLRFKEVAPTASDDLAEDFDANDAMQLLEYCKNGDLMSLLEKVTDKPLGGKHVLKIFACLIKGCIAMQYPPRRLRASNGNLLHGEEIGTPVPEVIPPEHLRENCAYKLVHFDLDPQNILLGDLDKDEHQAMPIFKIADFGLSLRTTSRTLSEPIDAMWLRRRGKSDHPLPEQFHKEWEFIDILPQDQMPPPKVAGQYGSASNVFAIGLCMHSVLTQASPPYPLEPFGPFNKDNPDVNNLIPAEYHVIHDLYSNKVAPFYTYGRSLTEKSYQINSTVISLLLRCMADQPAHRPSLVELEGWVQSLESIEGIDDPDDYYDSIFGQPPDAPADVSIALPEIRPFEPDNVASHRQRPNTEPLPAVRTWPGATTWIGPPRANSAPEDVDLERIPGSGVGAGDRSGDTDHFLAAFNGESLPSTLGPGQDDNSTGSRNLSEDWLGAKSENKIAETSVSSSKRQSFVQDYSSAANQASPSLRTHSEDESTWAGTRVVTGSEEGPSQRESLRTHSEDESTWPGSRDVTGSEQGPSQKGSVRTHSEDESTWPGSRVITESDQGSSQGGSLDQEGGEQNKHHQEAHDEDISSESESEQDVTASSSGLIDWMSDLLSGADYGGRLSSRAGVDRVTVSSDGVGMSSDEDTEDNGDNLDPERKLKTNSPGPNNGRESPSNSAVARGLLAARALRAARRSRSGPSRLARVLARLRIRPLPSRPPARETSPAREVRRAARSSRLGLAQAHRPAPAPAPIPQPAPTGSQPRRRLRRTGRLPERRSPRLGIQQGIPYPNVVAGQAQGIPVIPAGDNATRYPPYIPVEGGPTLLDRVEVPIAPGANIEEGDLPPIGDPRLLARAFAGEAAENMPLQGNADTIWHAPSLDMLPIPGYFRTHWATLFGVQRLVYFYRVGSEGANGVLATRLQNNNQGQ